MLTAAANLSKKSHEIVEAFQTVGFPLNRKLESMLNEAPEHQRPRRGSGFTQAGRFLAEFINQPRGLTCALDLRLFSETGQRKLSSMVATCYRITGKKPSGITQLHSLLQTHQQSEPNIDRYLQQLTALFNIRQELAFEESQLLINLLFSILGDQTENFRLRDGIPELPLTKEKLAIGTCPEAERYFLEFSGNYLRRHGIINIFTDAQNNPVIIEKIGIGDSHSCITIADTWLNQVLIPAGSLLGATYTELPINTKACAELNGAWMPISLCRGFRFLRLSTLAVTPENRARAYGNHLKTQLEGSPFFDPLNTTLRDLMKVAKQQAPR